MPRIQRPRQSPAVVLAAALAATPSIASGQATTAKDAVELGLIECGQELRYDHLQLIDPQSLTGDFLIDELADSFVDAGTVLQVYVDQIDGFADFQAMDAHAGAALEQNLSTLAAALSATGDQLLASNFDGASDQLQVAQQSLASLGWVGRQSLSGQAVKGNLEDLAALFRFYGSARVTYEEAFLEFLSPLSKPIEEFDAELDTLIKGNEEYLLVTRAVIEPYFMDVHAALPATYDSPDVSAYRAGIVTAPGLFMDELLTLSLPVIAEDLGAQISGIGENLQGNRSGRTSIFCFDPETGDPMPPQQEPVEEPVGDCEEWCTSEDNSCGILGYKMGSGKISPSDEKAIGKAVKALALLMDAEYYANLSVAGAFKDRATIVCGMIGGVAASGGPYGATVVQLSSTAVQLGLKYNPQGWVAVEIMCCEVQDCWNWHLWGVLCPLPGGPPVTIETEAFLESRSSEWMKFDAPKVVDGPNQPRNWRIVGEYLRSESTSARDRAAVLRRLDESARIKAARWCAANEATLCD